MLIDLLVSKLDKFDDIIFDLDNTLFDQRDYDIGAFEDIEVKLSRLSQKNITGFTNFLYQHKQKKGANYPFLFNDALATYKLPQDYLAIMLTEYYHHDGRYIKSKNSLIPSLLTIFSTKNAFIVTNGPTVVQQTKIDKLRLKNHTCEIIICDSKSPKTLKPNKYAYNLLMNKHHLTSTVMVGDTVETDGLFAKNAGIPFIHFDYIEHCHENT